MLTDPNKQAALERAMHQIAQLQASQPAGLSISTESHSSFRCKSIEREHGISVFRCRKCGEPVDETVPAAKYAAKSK